MPLPSYKTLKCKTDSYRYLKDQRHVPYLDATNHLNLKILLSISFLSLLAFNSIGQPNTEFLNKAVDAMKVDSFQR